MKSANRLAAISFGLFMFGLGAAPATAADNPEAEIAYILTRVETSSMTFVRNGRDYSGKDAAAHMKRKYKHFKRKIKSAEDFIRLAATKSEATDRPYLVKDPSQNQIPCDQWMSQLLSNHRLESNK